MVKFKDPIGKFRYPKSFEAMQCADLAELLGNHDIDLWIDSQAYSGSIYGQVRTASGEFLTMVSICDHPTRFSAKRFYNNLIAKGVIQDERTLDS